MNDYARLKGNATAPAAPARQAPVESPRELSEQETERVAENRAFVLKHMPEFATFIRELHALGSLPGWRAVENCKLL